MAPNCRTCQFFQVTWDKNFPYGCKAFGMKTKQTPSVEVKLTSGKDCLKYRPKPDLTKTKKP